MKTFSRYVPPPLRRAALVLIAVQVALTALYALNVHDVPGSRQFDMDGEMNVPTWWSTALFLVAGLAALGLARCNKLLGRAVAPWTLVGIGLFGLSLEEVAGIHEDVGVALGGGADEVSVWPVAYAPFVILGVWLLIKAVRDLPRPLAAIGLAGLISYVLVLAVELSALLGGDAATIAVEENLELLGSGAIFIAVASELSVRFGMVYVRADRAEVPAMDVAAVVGAAPAAGPGEVVPPPLPVR
jgi:hypothetical protein